ncbi:MAG: AsmA family protein [Desulfobacteraceae bacterium]
MKKFLKWAVIAAGVFVIAAVAAILLIPQLVDVNKYRPQIEELVTEKTGRPFELGGEMDISVFPWVGVKLTDLHLGNPDGFEKKDFISVKNFEVRLKVIPLLFKNVEVKTFVLEEPVILLEKRRNGAANWEGLGGKSDTGKTEKERKPAETGKSGQLPVKSLVVGNFSITDGIVRFSDRALDMEKEISDINLVLKDISLDSPVSINFSALVDEQPVSLQGRAGPIGKEPGKGEIPLDFTLKAAKQLSVDLKGSVIDPATRQQFDVNLEVSEFSLKKLFSALDQPFPVQTADPGVLEKISFATRVKGNSEAVALSDGRLVLDDSEITFTASAEEFSRPDVKFDVRLDQIDLDRYLPAAEKDTSSGETGKKQEKKTDGTDRSAEKTGKSGEIDYEPLRKLVLDGSVTIGRLKAYGAKIQDITLKVTGKDGIFHADPVKMNLYQGSVMSKARVDVRKSSPYSSISLDAADIKTGPLLKDTTDKNIIEGTVASDIDLSMKGLDADIIKKSLNGGGELVFNDGAIVGIDIAGMVRNAKSGISLKEKSKEKPRTDFTELRVPFDVKDRVVNTPGADLKSPLLRVSASGKADLVKTTLDYRIEPRVVGTLKGQGDVEKRSGLMVPFLVTGTFSSPKIKIDTKSLMQSEIPDRESLKEALKDKDTRKEKSEDLKEKAKGALKGFLE